jgi:lycopene beta-cyclase
MHKHYDIVISGAGMAGLSLACRALEQGVWVDKSILILDKSEKSSNDKTWCFWDNGESAFDNVVHRKWNDMLFFTNGGEKIVLDSGSFEYKMVRSIDFYNYTLKYLNSQPNIDFLYSEVTSTQQDNSRVVLCTKSGDISADFVFNSILKSPDIKPDDTYLLQHFKGKFIESDELDLNPDQIHLMDFRPSQHNGSTFVYLLPTSKTSALVEYTLFSEKLLEKSEYDANLDLYINDVMGINNYRTTDEEFGVIPMTDYRFERCPNVVAAHELFHRRRHPNAIRHLP